LKHRLEVCGGPLLGSWKGSYSEPPVVEQPENGVHSSDQVLAQSEKTFLGEVPVVHTEWVAVFTNQTKGNGKDATVEVSIGLGANLTEETVLVRAEEMVIRVVGGSGVRCAELTGEKGLAFLVCFRNFVGIIAHRPVPLVDETLIVATGTGRLAR